MPPMSDSESNTSATSDSVRVHMMADTAEGRAGHSRRHEHKTQLKLCGANTVRVQMMADTAGLRGWQGMQQKVWAQDAMHESLGQWMEETLSVQIMADTVEGAGGAGRRRGRREYNT